ncbi:hypothetical protein ACOCHS_02280 [Propionibacteriaceae bacterium Y2011]
MKRIAQLHFWRGEIQAQRYWLGLLADVGDPRAATLLVISYIRNSPTDLVAARSVCSRVSSVSPHRAHDLLRDVNVVDWERAARSTFGTQRSGASRGYVTLVGPIWDTDVVLAGQTTPLAMVYLRPGSSHDEEGIWRGMPDLGWLVVLLVAEPTGLDPHDRVLEVLIDPWEPRMDDVVATVCGWLGEQGMDMPHARRP